MSAIRRDTELTGFAGVRLTADEFLALGETAEQLQLINGVIVMSPRPSSLHQIVLHEVADQLRKFAKAHPGVRVFPEVDWELSLDHVYAPDIACYRPGRVQGFPSRLTLSPDLIVEVLSPGNTAFDLTDKKDDYEKHGVGEYWAVDPRTARVRCYRRLEGLLVEVPVTGNSLASAALEGFVLDIMPLRELAAEAQ